MSCARRPGGVGGGGAGDRLGLAQLLGQHLGRLGACLVAGLQPAQRLGLDGVAQLWLPVAEQRGGHDQQADQRQHVVADFEQALPPAPPGACSRRGPGGDGDNPGPVLGCRLARLPGGSSDSGPMLAAAALLLYPCTVDLG